MATMIDLYARVRALTPEQQRLLAIKMGTSSPVEDKIASLGAAYNTPAPLSFAQQRLWMLHQCNPSSPLYNTFLAVRFSGALNTGTLGRALSEVVRRHHSLRTVFVMGPSGPAQIVSPPSPCGIPIVDLQSIPEDRRENVARELCGQEIRRPFDLSVGPVMRTTLISMGRADNLLVLTMHHIVSDRWSIQLLIHELSVLYDVFERGHESPLPELEVQYRDFALWQRARMEGARLQQQLGYWKKQLQGPLPKIDFSQRVSTVPSFEGGRVSSWVQEHLMERIARLSREQGTTLFMTMLAAYYVLLYRYFGQDDLMVGTPITARGPAGTQELIGFFLNTLVLRNSLKGDPAFQEVLSSTRKMCLDAYANQDLPFERVVEELHPERSGHPASIFQVMFTLNDMHDPAQSGRFLNEKLRAHNLNLAPLELDTGTSAADLVLHIERRPGASSCALEYSCASFSSPMARQMLDSFLVLLEEVANAPLKSIGDLSCLTSDRRSEILHDWNLTGTAYPREQAVHSLFEQRAKESPQSVAAVIAGTAITYAELNRQANQLARYLQRQGVEPESRVCVYLGRSLDLLVSMLAILKLGSAYVPLDSRYPPVRLAYIAKDASASVVITRSESLREQIDFCVRTICLDELKEEISAEDGNDLAVPVDSSMLAYLIYTSGTTGKPKGVGVPHYGITRLVINSNYIDLGPSDCIAQASSASFDAATFEIWGALLNGSRYVHIPEDILLSPALLQETLKREGITVLFLTTALFNRVARDIPSAFQSLDSLLFGGEACDPEAIQAVLVAGPPRRLLHVYGPTENTTFSTWHLVREVGAGVHTVPIGRPIANSSCYILDSTLEPIPPGVVGELFVGGDGLARGYINDAALTAGRFLPDPHQQRPGARMYRTGDLARYGPFGDIEFVGRVDHQIKLRGFRIELGEIEEALRKFPGVREATVILREDTPGNKYLAAYLEARVALSIRELRALLKVHLPDYMVPSAFTVLPELPVNANGKIDRAALPAPVPFQEPDENDFGPPTTPTEKAVAAIWSELLGREISSVGASFFELGGHSLLAIQVMTRLRTAWSMEFPMRLLFENATIAEFAAALDDFASAHQRAGENDAFLKPIVPDPSSRFEPFPLTEVQQAYWLGRTDNFELGNVSSHGYFEVEFADLDLARFERALQAAIDRHDTLRTVIHATGQQQILASVPPYRIETSDLAGLLPEEVQKKLLEVRDSMSHQVLPSDRWPLFEFRASLLPGGKTRLHISTDALIGDAWSWKILAKDLARLYHDPAASLPPLAITFRDYVLAEAELKESPLYQRSLDYWRTRLENFPPAPEFPLLPAKNGRPGFERRRGGLEPALWTRLKARAGASGLTSSGFVLAVLADVMALWSGNHRFTLTLTLLNRLQLHPQIDEVAGDFTSLVLVALEQQLELSFLQRAQKVQAQLMEALDHHYVNGVWIIRELSRKNGGKRVSFPVVFTSLLGLDLSMGSIPTIQGEFVYSISQTPQVWLDCQAYENDGALVYSWDSVADLFPEGFLDGMFHAFSSLLHSLATDDSLWEKSRPYQLPPGQMGVMRDANATQGPVSEDLLHMLFAERAERQPESIAVIASGRTLTYGELHRYMLQLGRQLQDMDVRPDELVAVVMQKGWEQVAAVLGVLQSGAAYLPIDPSLPQERIDYLIRNGSVKVVLTQSWLSFSLPEGVACIPVDLFDVQRELGRLPKNIQNCDHLAYVIYTSGSTGLPKGVMIRHRGAVNTILDVNRRFGVTPDDRVFALSSLSFDLSVYDVFGTLAAGAAIVIPQYSSLQDPAHWLSLLDEHGVTVWNSVPALMNMLVEHVDGQSRGLPATLRLVMLSGDWIPLPLPSQIRGLSEKIEIVSLGGATEASIWSILYPIHEISPEWRSVPYGRPMANQTFHVLDPALGPRPIWVSGELYIGGIGVADGYWRDEEKTSAKFIRHPQTGDRLYRTGDYGRYLPDGNLEFLGRQDQQVKIQGYRIELGEIEAALSKHEGIRDCAVTAASGVGGGKQLVAYVVGKEAAPPQRELRAFLQERLPSYMVPVTFISCDALPLTANGKVDRNALSRLRPAPAEVSDLSASPDTPTSELLRGIWADVLKVQSVQLQDDFFLLGGHSMLATRLITRIRDYFQVELPLRAIFEFSRLADMARHIDSVRMSQDGQAIVIAPAERGERIPLSFAQQRLWFIDRLVPGSPAYNMPLALQLAGKLDLPVLERCLREIESRHESLRTVFRSLEGKPYQVVLPASGQILRVANLENLPADKRHSEARRLAELEGGRSFDLSDGPLLRALLIRTAAEEHLLCVTMHHVVSDGWSLGIFLREMTALYDAFVRNEPSPLADLEIQYADFSIWQRNYLAGEVLERQLEYWRDRLADAPTLLQLPLDRPRPPVQTFAGAHCPVVVAPELAAALKQIARDRHVTLYMLLLAAFQTFLSRISGQDDLLVGSPIANRDRAPSESLIGFFANTLVFRANFSGDPVFGDFLESVRETALSAYAHQEVPFDQVVEHLQPRRALSHSPLFQVMFVFQNTGADSVQLPALELKRIDLKSETVHFDLTLRLWEEANGIVGRLEYNLDILSDASVTLMAKRFERLLRSIALDTDQRVSSLDMATDEERNQLQAWNSTACGFPMVMVPRMIEDQARLYPDSIAVICDETRLSYRELDEQSARIAGHLAALGVGPETTVGILMERSSIHIVALLGVLKSGGNWLPLDPAYPQDRIVHILSDSGASLVLDRVRIEEFLSCPAPASLATVEFSAEMLAYVIYTSGSTGAPKGVMITHGNISNYVQAMRQKLKITRNDVYLHTASFSFSSSVRQLLLPLSCGATVALATASQISDPRVLLGLVRQRHVTVMDLVPSYWRNSMAVLSSASWEGLESVAPESLRMIVSASEPLLRDEIVDVWRKKFGERVELVNMFGQTETAGIVATYDIPRVAAIPTTIVPAGSPIPNTTIYVLDSHGNPAPAGIVGEIYIGGKDPGRGYLGQPGLTAERFVPDPFSGVSGGRLYRTGDLGRYRPEGTLDFIGRKDRQIKVNGIRVELGEVEISLNQHPAIAEAAVISHVDASGFNTLAAFVVWNGDSQLALEQLRSDLLGKLPEYMVPGQFFSVEKLPRTASGKLDRHALSLGMAAYVPIEEVSVSPRSEVECQIHEIFAQLLGRPQISVHANFFILGGHSLLATQVISRLESAFGVDLPLRILFEAPTIAELAECIEIAKYVTQEGGTQSS